MKYLLAGLALCAMISAVTISPKAGAFQTCVWPRTCAK